MWRRCLPPEWRLRSDSKEIDCDRNHLPAYIRQSNSVEAFESKLKTHLFTLTFNECYSFIPEASSFQQVGLSLNESISMST